jgi:ribosomal protein S18 acetylase RimI-like enzyme
MRKPAVRVAQRHERQVVLACLAAQVGVHNSDAFITEALQLMGRDQAAGAYLFGAWDRDRCVSAAWVVPLAGASALVWPPLGQGFTSHPAEGCLWPAIHQALRELRVKLAQIVLPEYNDELTGAFAAQGFSSLTSLLYLKRHLQRVAPAAVPALHFVPTSPNDPDLAWLIVATYEGSLDCPELDGIRTGEEILRGHAGDEAEVQPHWWVIQSSGTRIGVMLANSDREVPLWELVYFGLIPQVRGRGWGRAALTWLLATAQDYGAQVISLAVDSRNIPARRIYAALGFAEYDARHVWYCPCAAGDARSHGTELHQ